jgi:hypothetical protein
MRKVSVSENIKKIEKSIEDSKNEIMRLQGCLMVFKGFMDEGLETIELPSEKSKSTPCTGCKPKLEEPKLEEPKLEEPKPKEPKLEEPKLEEPKLEEPKKNHHHHHNHDDKIDHKQIINSSGINEEYVIETC